jgi:pyridoxal phosphate enzyme (YggS family)
MSKASTVAANLAHVQEQIAAACARVQRDPASVTLVAVSKTQPVEVLLEAVGAGVQHFGENRVEEGISKIPTVNERAGKPLTWHMIGHVQSRKAKDVPALFQVVHSLDSLKLAEKYSRHMVERGGRLDVLLEINVSGEASKEGFDAAQWSADTALRERLWGEIGHILTLPGLNVRGLMTMAPIVPQIELTRPVFDQLAGLRQALVETFHVALPELSMGMTDDYPVAIEAGATMVRIGRAIFGERRR